MFPELRRKKQQLSEEETLAILEKGGTGVLSLQGDAYPYGVPLNFIYHDGALFFHAAKAGYKLDLIRQNPNASFCVIDRDQTVKEAYTTYFKSVIVFGEIEILEDPEQILEAIDRFATHFFPEDTPQHRQQAIQKDLNGLLMLKLNIRHKTGKQAIELVDQA